MIRIGQLLRSGGGKFGPPAVTMMRSKRGLDTPAQRSPSLSFMRIPRASFREKLPCGLVQFRTRSIVNTSSPIFTQHRRLISDRTDFKHFHPRFRFKQL